ncbi:hypothetical protein [Arthrobacter sp. H41]|uniref:hypothetical protein n=1 Tax=Arthrobacter sp. H41 TaxID=1312978 RepID=UPI00047D7530|nr:hypothetical protein [Arthrobacter sp. H41]
MTTLFIKIDFGNTPSTDDGSRPYTGSTQLWNNASIFLTGGVTQTQTRVNSPTTVNVRVSNAGRTSIEDVNVDAYVMDPFVGAFDPNSAIITVKGFAHEITAGSGGSSPNDSHVVKCLVQDPAQGAIPWTPTQSQFDKSGGHLCLVANCYTEDDGGPLPLTQIFDVGSDPHQGQRNISLLTGTVSMKMMINVMPGPDGEDTALDLHRLAGTTARQGGEHWLLQSHPNIVGMKDARLGLGIPGRGGKPGIQLTLSRKEVSGSLDIEGIGSTDLGELARTTEELRPDSSRRSDWGDGRLVVPGTQQPTPAVITVDRSDMPGSLQAFDLVQRTAKGRVLGGLRVLSVQF